jgi:large subunit ribosomal protein L18
VAKTIKLTARQRRHRRVRKRISGDADRPRLCVFRSLRHIYAQVVDDLGNRVLAAAGTLDPALRESRASAGNADAARAVGELIAQRAREAGVERVAFDRGGYLYHGRVRALAEGARAGGLEF